ncbi:MAG: hypothetical protein JNG89_03260 [Planctomycetaceae bacterium]|nr:hypothetical protein [Planctomycetaceae bacterium]
MRTVTRTLVLSALAVVFCQLGAVAQDGAGAYDVDDKVVPKESIDLKVKDAVVETVDSSNVLTVERVQDKWLWVVTEKGTKGWVKADAVEPYDPASAPDTPPDAPETPLDPPTDRLMLIGGLSGANLYTTYAYVGVLADGLSKDLYTAEQTKLMLGEVVTVSDNLIKNMVRVRDGGLSPDDTQSIDNMIEIYKLLQDEARAAIEYADSRSVTDAENFENARKTVWPKIATLLGISAEQ